jgi:hypothetical protein
VRAECRYPCPVPRVVSIYTHIFYPLYSNGLANKPHLMKIQACCLHCVTFACNVYSVITGVYCNNTDHAVNPWPWYVCPPPPSAAVYSLLTNVNIWEEYNTQFPRHACKFIVMNTCISMHSTPPVRYKGGDMFWKIGSLLYYCGDFQISFDPNNSTNKMRQLQKFITWGLCVAQNVSGDFPPIIRSLQLH